MLETEYKELLEDVVPGDRLITETVAKMEAAADLRYAPRERLRTILIAAVVLAGIIGASAISLTGSHFVDWSGNTVEFDYGADGTSEGQGFETQSRDQIFWDSVDEKPEDELWMGKTGSGIAMRDVSKTFHSYPEAESHIRALAPDLMLPAVLPEGYDFTNGQIIYYMSEDVWKNGVSLISKELLPKGLIIFKFMLPENVFQNIEGYMITFTNKAGDVLSFQCNRETMSSKISFRIKEGGSSEPVNMPGMEEGIFIKYPADGSVNELNLRKAGKNNICFYEWDNLPELKRPSDPDQNATSLSCFRDTRYSVSATAFGKEELMKIAEGLK